jgi:citrate lyase subunit beta/citryl-CoA lyase
MSTPVPISVLATALSFLFVPGHRPERFAKALVSGAHAVIIDLEDAVPMSAKAEARSAIGAAWAGFSAEQRCRFLVRTNPVSTSWHADDMGLLGQLTGLGGVMLPKAESGPSVAAVAAACPGLPVLPLIESAEGLTHLDAIANAPQVVRLGLGHIDLQADLSMACGSDEAELAPARWALVVASRRAKLVAPVDGVTTATHYAEALLRDTRRSRRFGFGAKLCIHPAQVTGVHEGFAATEAELDWAQRVLAAEQVAGGGAFSIDGKMIDPPVLLLAHQLLRRARSVPPSVGGI